jgi:methyl-accepting chemotaxis protein
MIILSLVIVCAIGITLLVQSSDDVTALSHEKAVATVQDYASDVKNVLTSYWTIAETLSDVVKKYDNIIPESRREYIITLLEGLLETNENIIGAWTIWEKDVLEGNDENFIGTPGTANDGRFSPYLLRQRNQFIVSSFINEEGKRAEDYYNLTKNKNQTLIHEPYLKNIAWKETLMANITTPIHESGTGRILGVIGINLNMDMIQEMSQNHKPFGNGLTAVFSNSGIVVGIFDPSRIGRNMTETEHDMAGEYLDDFVKAINNGQLFYFTNFITSANAEFNIVAAPIKIGDTPWSFAIAVPIKTVMASVDKMKLTTIIISLIILAIVIPVAIFLSKSFTSPIIKLAETLKDISEGEGDLTHSISVQSKDEIGKLAHYFNKTLEKIKGLVVTIKNETNELSGIGNELSSNMNQTTAAINEITSNIQGIKSRVINQSASVTQTNATMEQISGNINKLNNQVEKQTGSVSQSSSAIEQMLANIKSVTQTLFKNAANVNILSSASEAGRAGLQEVAADIHKIAQDSEGLMEINSVMQNIASQTNLLSMNAAIEAAHAGEAGNGFSVVADEIRKLAEDSGEQSKTISLVLKNIKKSIDNIISSTEKVISKFEAIDQSVKIVSDQEKNICNAMEEQSDGSKQILEVISRLNEITHQVEEGSNEMNDGAKEVIQESRNLEKITQEITGGMNEMASGAGQINDAVNRVNELSVINRQNIDILMKEVSRFKVA